MCLVLGIFVTGVAISIFFVYIGYDFTRVGIGRFCVYYRLWVLQMWGSVDFVFIICYGFYRCGDRQIFFLNVGCVCSTCGGW